MERPTLRWPPRRRTGFIFVFGSRNRVTNDGAAVPAVCPKCRQQATLQNKAVRTWFTLFFIPVFPMGAKRQFCQCSNCNTQFRGRAEQLSQKVAASQQQDFQQAIQMYNSLRASPANSVTLNNLLEQYLQLQEYDQAISAANEFQQALHNSEQCMTTLGRVYLARKQPDEAIKWFDAAIGRNPMLGEASYCKALALMGQSPPDLAGAATAARSARSSGMQAADALLREIQQRTVKATG